MIVNRKGKCEHFIFKKSETIERRHRLDYPEPPPNKRIVINHIFITTLTLYYLILTIKLVIYFRNDINKFFKQLTTSASFFFLIYSILILY